MIRKLCVLSFLAVLIVPAQSQTMPRGNAKSGARLFQDLHCAKCHAPGGDKSLANRLTTPEAMASAMWSHATTMWDAMQKAGIERPKLTEQNASDLFAFLSPGRRQSAKPGSAETGRRVYEAKLCSTCHDDIYSGSPALTKLAGRTTPYTVIAALWQHGGGMLSRMIVKDLAWQRLSAEEMAHLVAFLNTRRPTPEAK